MVGRSWSRIRSSYQSIRRTPTRLAIDSIETIKAEPTQTMPASSHLFATRTHTPILAKRDRPEREPIIERLPPLPVIHDMGLALAATNLREGREVFMTMAQAGDRCLLGHEAFSRARDAYPIQRAGAGVSRRQARLMADCLFLFRLQCHLVPSRVYIRLASIAPDITCHSTRCGFCV